MNNRKEEVKHVIQYFQSLKDFKWEQPDVYTHMGALITDASFQARRPYDSYVRPKAVRVERDFPDACTTSGFESVLKGHGTEKVLDLVTGKEPIKVHILHSLVRLFLDEKIETVIHLRLWHDNPENQKKLSFIKHVGPKTISYIGILAGKQDSAIDTHLRGFLRAAGIPSLRYEEERAIVNSVADQLGVSRSIFEHSIWHYMRQKSRT